MADYFQNGLITTIHNLSDRKVDELEQELLQFKDQGSPMALVLPSLFSELEGPALKNIVSELQKVPYLDEVIIGLDRADAGQFAFAKEYFKPLRQRFTILWNDGDRLKGVNRLLEEHSLAPDQPGKGRNVWFCLGYFLASGRAKTVALHDCDITTYDRSMLAKLFYPVANPTFGFKFCKGYYYRAANRKLNGRVTRLLITPLVRALKVLCKDQGFLDYINSFRYPLAGEFCMYHDVVTNIRIPSDWGLEIGVLSEVYRNYALNKICQVDIADHYDHKHQPLSEGDPEAGLSRMSLDISKAFFRKLAILGEVFSTEFFRSLKATYYRMALDAIEQYYADATMNGLVLDRHAEESAVEMFAKNLTRAGEIYLATPEEVPFMPAWNRVVSAIPDIFDRLKEAVEEDNR